ncbi:MAG: hypothetical protein VW518_09980 [Burkholderiaceae bacterium]
MQLMDTLGTGNQGFAGDTSGVQAVAAHAVFLNQGDACPDR